MKKTPFPAYYLRAGLVALLLLLSLVSCLPSAAPSTPAPGVTVVEVNREVTRQVIQEVTRIVYVPVTVTPAPGGPSATATPLPTPTRATSPTAAQTPIPPNVTLLIHTECLYGPDPVYLGRYAIQVNSPQQVIGRNADASWLEVRGADHGQPCWVKALVAKVSSGSLDTVPVVDPVLSPYSNQYTPPQAVSTNRVGNDVTIFWLPIAMAEADYNGYLIEAWVCQGGQIVFEPRTKSTTFDDTKMLAIKVTDEPGCQDPSRARIYSVTNQNYSPYKDIPWPNWPTSSLTLTPAP